jgi:hypothetical protein
MIAKILGALLLLALAGFGIQSWRVSHCESTVTAFRSAVATFESAQKTNLATIAALKATNADWANKCAVHEPEARSEADKAAAYAKHQQAAGTAAKKAIHDLSASHPQVRDWYSAPVPADVVRILAGGQD